MGLLRTVFKIVAIVVLALVGLAAFLYFTDYGAEGVVKEKGTDSGGSYVVIRPKLVPYDIKQRVDTSVARVVCTGYQVTYHVQTGHYVVKDAKGTDIYDSDTKVPSPAAALCPAGL